MVATVDATAVVIVDVTVAAMAAMAVVTSIAIASSRADSSNAAMASSHATVVLHATVSGTMVNATTVSAMTAGRIAVRAPTTAVSRDSARNTSKDSSRVRSNSTLNRSSRSLSWPKAKLSL